MRIAAISLAIALLATPAAADIYVLDGDTIVVDREHIRLTGFNTPETRDAQCEGERALGYRAKARLHDLLTMACGPLARAPAACLTLERLPAPDRYGRSLARLTVQGRDVAAILISEGLAEQADKDMKDAAATLTRLSAEVERLRKSSTGTWASQRENDALTIQYHDMKARAEAAEAEAKRQFHVGYVLALANVVHLHDQPCIAADAMNEIGLSWGDIRRMGLDEYDMKVLRRIRRARNPSPFQPKPRKARAALRKEAGHE